MEASKFMKKRLLSIFTSAMMFSSFTAVHCENDIKVLLDGVELEFDVLPQIIDERTFVPLRAIFEALGAEVEWDGVTQTVTAKRDKSTVSLTIGRNIINVNTETVELDVPPQIIDGRTLVPARAVAESFDCIVDWDGKTHTVTITSAQDKPAASEEPTEKPVQYPIKYNSDSDVKAHYMRNFKLTDVQRNEQGKFDISYTLETFLEGRGTVSVTFRCLDKNGETVDEWSKIYVGTDYTWSRQEDSVTISGETATIELVLNK